MFNLVCIAFHFSLCPSLPSLPCLCPSCSHFRSYVIVSNSIPISVYSDTILSLINPSRRLFFLSPLPVSCLVRLAVYCSCTAVFASYTKFIVVHFVSPLRTRVYFVLLFFLFSLSAFPFVYFFDFIMLVIL